MQEMQEMQAPGLERSPGIGMATHSSILAWEIPRAEEPQGLQSMGSQTVRHDWATEHTYSDTCYNINKPQKHHAQSKKTLLIHDMNEVQKQEKLIYDLKNHSSGCLSGGGDWLEGGSVELSGTVDMFYILFGLLVTWVNRGHICLNSLPYTLKICAFCCM